IRPGDPHLSASDLLFPLNLRRQLQWPAYSVWRISNPRVTRLRRIQSDIRLRGLRRKFADLCGKPVTSPNIQFVLLSSQNQPIEPATTRADDNQPPHPPAPAAPSGPPPATGPANHLPRLWSAAGNTPACKARSHSPSDPPQGKHDPPLPPRPLLLPKGRRRP